ncbi:YgeY family selenium metabolism-linked hydrolase [candidate division KSB1 bacterium]|nr:YgeY family selenium metabolism-linked hydrolase [candidate division KSB1 bacterium]
MNYDFLKLAKELEQDCLNFLLELIAIKSMCSEEKNVIQRINQEMEKLEYDDITIDPMGNILGRVGNGPIKIALDAHVDTVDVGNLSLWETDPFKGVIKNRIVYGRGAGDMKGALASIVYAGGLIKKLGLTDGISLYITGTVMEEDCDGLCWQYIAKEDKLRPDCVVIAEPTNLNIHRGQRGRMDIQVVTKGISSHGAMPERGVNAIYKMAPIIADVEQLNHRLKQDEFLGKGTITISQIRSTSPSLNAVADGATIHIDRRLTAGETLESALNEIKSLPSVQQAEAEVIVPVYDTPSYTGLKYPTKKYFPTWVIEEDHYAIQSGVKAYQQVFGDHPIVDKWNFSTNGVATMGMLEIPTIGFGPGNEIYAHSPQDQVPVDHLHKAIAFYTAFPQHFKNEKEELE